MAHIDYWYRNDDINAHGAIDKMAVPIHTLNLPEIEITIHGHGETEKQPDTLDFFPSVDFSRVTGYRYKPYKKGSELWRNAANKLLSSKAQSNFQNR